MPAGRIYRAADMLADPHYLARQAIVRLVDPELGEIAMQNVAPRLSATPGRVAWPGPPLGRHHHEDNLGRLGRPGEEDERLADQGVI